MATASLYPFRVANAKQPFFILDVQADAVVSCATPNFRPKYCELRSVP